MTSTNASEALTGVVSQQGIKPNNQLESDLERGLPQHGPPLLPLEERDVVEPYVVVKPARLCIVLQPLQLSLLRILGWNERRSVGRSVAGEGGVTNRGPAGRISWSEHSPRSPPSCPPWRGRRNSRSRESPRGPVSAREYPSCADCSSSCRRTRWVGRIQLISEYLLQNLPPYEDITGKHAQQNQNVPKSQELCAEKCQFSVL